jgi:hypothetical protein
MGKSAEVIDGKGVAMAPLGQRVRNHLKTKGIDDVDDFSPETLGRGGPHHPPATMQKLERKRIAGGASRKLLKTKVQICTGIAGPVGS